MKIQKLLAVVFVALSLSSVAEAQRRGGERRRPPRPQVERPVPGERGPERHGTDRDRADRKRGEDKGAPNRGERPGRRPAPKPPEREAGDDRRGHGKLLDAFDRNRDGKLDAREREAVRKALQTMERRTEADRVLEAPEGRRRKPGRRIPLDRPARKTSTVETL